jgi:hypothetical protein
MSLLLCVCAATAAVGDGGATATVQMFDVDTSDVLERIGSACWPFQTRSFFEIVGDNPDLYG